MLYNLHSLGSFWSKSLNSYAAFNASLSRHNPWLRHWYAANKLLEGYTRDHFKPEFRLGVEEHRPIRNTFGDLLTFGEPDPERPNLLLVAPLSGHFATLLRNTVWEFLPDFNVAITDWHDAAEIPPGEGQFGIDDYIDYLCDYIDHFDGNLHIMAVCQAAVPALAAVASRAQQHAATPISLTLLGGPIDTRIAETSVGRFVRQQRLEWFREQVVQEVPPTRKGVGRQVYPGFLQLTGMLALNLDRHIQAHYDYFVHLVEGDGESSEQHEAFYNEYLSVMDLDAPFYLDTIQRVFLEHQLAEGTFHHWDQRVDLAAINNTALMTVEGGRDDVTAPGQTEIAHKLCPNAPLHVQHLQPGVGHFGVFNGQCFRRSIAPRIRQFIRQAEGSFRLATADENQLTVNERLPPR